MVPSAAQESSEELPKGLFFGVEDRRLGGRAGLTDKHLAVERIRRHQMAEQLKNAANQVIRSISSLKDFDQTGHTDQALDHVVARLDDVAKLGRNLVNEIETSIDRYGDELDALHARDTEEARAALNAPAAPVAPQPGAAGPTAAAASPTPQQLAAAAPKQGGVILSIDVNRGASMAVTPLEMQVARAVAASQRRTTR
jgi:hypothetical protein